MPYPNVHFVFWKKLKVVGTDVVSIVYRWGGIETRRCYPYSTQFYISIVYRWGGIETRWCHTIEPHISLFLLSTAEAVLRLRTLLRHNFSAHIFLLSTAEAVLRHHPAAILIYHSVYYFYRLPLRRYWDRSLAILCRAQALFLLSTAEAVLRQSAVGGNINLVAVMYFYCLPLRRYWDLWSQRMRPSTRNFYCLPLRRYWDNC